MNIKLALVIALANIFLITGCAESKQSAQMIQQSELSVATFAGGCFWCVEADFEKIPGVHEVISGFTGGQVANPDYQQVSKGTTGHVEAVQVYYDPKVIHYNDLLQAFWRQIDPTDDGGQFVDRGEPYRTAIFYHNDVQLQLAEKSKQNQRSSGRYDKPIVTKILPLKTFYSAENYHQDYYRKNPIRYKYYRFLSGRDQYLAKTWRDDIKFHPSSRQKYFKPSDTILRSQLTPLQYRVTQQNATERAFVNLY